MKLRRPVLCIIALIAMQVCAEAQAIRAAYKFYYKKDVTEKGFYVEPDMMLDYDGKTAAFYSDATYHRDSLKSLAFDNNGSIQDQDAYNQIFNYRPNATQDITLIDFQHRSFEIGYHALTVHIIGKSDNLEMPQWELHDTTTTSTLGYEVKMATADFMGRKWTIWYTEEIPVPAGPWLLCGAPGLIVHAKDSENIFIFKLLNVDLLDAPTRYDNLKKHYHDKQPKMRYYSYDLKNAEKIHNRTQRDTKFSDELSGMNISSAYIVHQNGEKEMYKNKRPYIPLIAEDYWK
ncbi:MAG: GLPGLI family protein [Bacteroidales bacterium]|nr:GLPGLI family protein [Bacteroidales bacterium]